MNKKNLIEKLKDKVFEITKAEGFLTYIYTDNIYQYCISVFEEKIIFNVFRIEKGFLKKKLKPVESFELTQKEFEVIMYTTFNDFITKNRL
jgi:hypothetical protein